MQIEALKTFCDIARLKSFSRAAAENGVSQAAASLMVHQLEERLGVSLIDRSQRPWKLTEQGQIFYEGCRELVDRYEGLEARVKDFNGTLNAVVRVASIYSVGLGPMNQHIREFMEEHPGIRIEIDYLHPNRVYEAVENKEADFGIVSFPQARREFRVLSWCDEKMVIACPNNHPMARKRSIRLKELTGQKFVAFDRGLEIRKQIDRFLKSHKIAVDTEVEFDNIEAIKSAIEVGSGLSLLPRPTIDREVRSGSLTALDFSPNGFVRPLGFIHRRGKKMSENVKLFIEHLIEKKKMTHLPLTSERVLAGSDSFRPAKRSER